MHIHHIVPTKDRVMVSRPVTWTLSERGNLVCEVGGTKYEAVRRRTDYGWCWFQVYENGTKRPGFTFTETPETMDGYVGISEALASPCMCGCTAGLQKQVEEWAGQH